MPRRDQKASSFTLGNYPIWSFCNQWRDSISYSAGSRCRTVLHTSVNRGWDEAAAKPNARHDIIQWSSPSSRQSTIRFTTSTFQVTTISPEFATIVAVEVSSDTSSSQPPHSQIPKHSKFLNSAPLVTAPVKGGVLSAVPLRISPMTGSFRSGEYTTPRKSSSAKQHRQDTRCP